MARYSRDQSDGMKHPERLGKYTIMGTIGEGAMGIVYKGRDPVIQRPVAIKTIHKWLAKSTESGAMMAARFRNEAQAAGRLQHPGVVAVYEYGEEDDVAFIAMEYVEGESLEYYVSRGIRFSDADIRSVMVQLLDALDHAHSLGVWHRDIKPANLIITRTGKLKVADFGIARIDLLPLTRVNSLLGTPSYMAPEQYLGGPVDHRVDIWASGVLLYQLVTGKLPFTGSAESVMYQVVHEQPIPPSHLTGSTRPGYYDDLVATALAKQPGARYATPERFRDALLAASSEPVNAAVSEESLIRDMARSDRPKPGEAWGSVGRGVGSTPSYVGPAAPGGSGARSTGPAPPTGWDAATLAQLQASLARYLGPIARVLVHRAAKESTDIVTLKHKLAAHLSTESERAAFLGQSLATSVGARTSPGRVTRSGVAPTAAMGSMLGTTPLTPGTIDQAARLLTTYIGPIAQVVAKKAAAQAATREHFVALLAEHVEEGPERHRLLDALSRIR